MSFMSLGMFLVIWVSLFSYNWRTIATFFGGLNMLSYAFFAYLKCFIDMLCFFLYSAINNKKTRSDDIYECYE